MKIRISLIFILVILIQSFSVSAHSDEPRLEISVDRMIPGGVIDVRGVAFDYEEVVTLTLIGAQSELPFGEVIADIEGVFLHTVTLPIELAEGTYYFRGITSHHYIINPALTVQGNAILSEGEDEEERWEEEDYLPYAIPTYPPGVVPGVVTGATQSIPVETTPAPNQNWVIFALAALTIISISILLVFRRKHQS